MRWFVLILIVAALLGAGYKYYYPQWQESRRGDQTAPTAATSGDAQAPHTPDVAGQPAAAVDPLPPAPEPDPAEPDDGFRPPDFQPLEVVVGDWQEIPDSAFPRDITLTKGGSFQMTVGSSTVPAGSPAVALGIEDQTLIVSPAVGAVARGQVHIDDTNFKQVLADEYESWKDRMTERARRQWEHARTAPERELTGEAAEVAARAAGVSGPPSQDDSGSYDVVMQSMASGQVREVRPDNITRWGRPALVEIDGQTYWAVTVDFVAMTRFGPFPTQAQALIRDGRVERWVYTGSGEPVP